MSTERHVIGHDTHIKRQGRWARCGVRLGSFLFIPGFAYVAVGGYVLI